MLAHGQHRENRRFSAALRVVLPSSALKNCQIDRKNQTARKKSLNDPRSGLSPHCDSKVATPPCNRNLSGAPTVSCWANHRLNDVASPISISFLPMRAALSSSSLWPVDALARADLALSTRLGAGGPKPRSCRPLRVRMRLARSFHAALSGVELVCF